MSLRRAFSHSPVKSIRTAAKKLELLSATVHKVYDAKGYDCMYAYKVQMLEKLQPNDKPKRKEFADSTLQQISEDKELLTASNTDPVSINFLCNRRIEECDGGFFPYFVLYLC